MTTFTELRNLVYRALLLAMEICSTGSFVHLLTRGQQMIVDVGDTVPLECEFYTDDFNLFDNPILWRKTQLHETTQMNMMGNLMEPYASVGRFRVSFVQTQPRYILGMTITGAKHEDSGNYTCEVNGPHNVLLGFVTHYIYVRATIESLIIVADNSTEYGPSRRQSAHLTYTEERPGVLRCVAVGGYPPADLAVYVGRRETTAEMGQAHSARLSGSRGMRTIEYTAERWSREFSPRAADDGKTARCVATVAGLPANTTQATITVNYAPVITCHPSSAYLGDRNPFIQCEVKARPWVHSLYWILDLNGTTITKGESVSEYWTKVVDSTSGALETTLYMRQAKQENFRVYTLIVENSIAPKSQQVQLVQKHRTVPTVQATPRSSYSRKGTSPSTDTNQAFGSGRFHGSVNRGGTTAYACRISRLRVAFVSVIIVFFSSLQLSVSSLSDVVLLAVVR